MSLAPGTRIGKYTVRRKIAEGGMAEIFLCAALGPEGFSKDVVIKRVRPFLGDDPAFVSMFIAEARLASRLEHPNIVAIFDFDRHEDTFYLAMEYVRGASLWHLRRRCREVGRAFPPLLAAHVGAEVARALAYAHRLTVRGEALHVVHRDVTPHNVLVSFEGAVKLTDFGIAHAGKASTAPGMLKGKFAYMSPEQARGETVDGRCDVFALGVVLWELLTGGRPFEAESDFAVLRAVQQRPIAPPARLNPDVPPELDAVVMRALERDPARRWQGAQEFQRALEEVVIAHRRKVEDTDVGAFLRCLVDAADTEVSELGPTPEEISLSAIPATPPGPLFAAEGTPVLPRPGGPLSTRPDGRVREPAAPVVALALQSPASSSLSDDGHGPTWLVARDGAQPPALLRAPSLIVPPPPRRAGRIAVFVAALACGAAVGLLTRHTTLLPSAEDALPSRPSSPSASATGLPPDPVAAPTVSPERPAAPRADLPPDPGGEAGTRGSSPSAPLAGSTPGPPDAASAPVEGALLALDAAPSTPAAQPAHVPPSSAPVPQVQRANLVQSSARPPVSATGPTPERRSRRQPTGPSGVVVLDVFPVAQVKVDGRSRGEVSGRHSLRLSAGYHNVLLAHPHRSESFEIEVKEDSTQELRFNAFRSGG